MEAPARVAQQTFHQPTNQPTNRIRGTRGIAALLQPRPPVSATMPLIPPFPAPQCPPPCLEGGVLGGIPEESSSILSLSRMSDVNHPTLLEGPY